MADGAEDVVKPLGPGLDSSQLSNLGEASKLGFTKDAVRRNSEMLKVTQSPRACCHYSSEQLL